MKRWLISILMIAFIVVASPMVSFLFPSTGFSMAVASEETEKGSDLQIEDGSYALPIALWHASADKASMGNAGLVERAELFVENGVARLYVESKVMQVGTIATAMRHIYYQNGDRYLLATPADPSLAVPGFEAMRARIFSIPMASKVSELPVLVDPQVALMGTDPIAARLKIDWSAIKPWPQDQGTLHEKGEGKEPESNAVFSASGVNVRLSQASEKELDLFVEMLSGETLTALQEEGKVGRDAIAWKVSLAETLKEIPVADLANIKALRVNYEPNGPLTLSFFKPPGEGSVVVFKQKADGGLETLSSEGQEDSVSVESDALGVFLVGRQTAAASANTPKVTPKTPASEGSSTGAPLKVQAAAPAAIKTSASGSGSVATPASKGGAAPAKKTAKTASPKTKTKELPTTGKKATGGEGKKAASEPQTEDEKKGLEEKEQGRQERPSIIIAVLLMFALLIGSASIVCWRMAPQFLCEWERHNELVRKEREVHR